MPIPKPSLVERIFVGAMRLFYRQLYHSFSWGYDFVARTVSVGRWNDWVGTAAARVQGPRVLELGFGPGHLQVRLRAEGHQVFGLDESLQMARQAGTRLRAARQAPQLARGLAQALPFPGATFNTIVATFPTLYIVDPDTLAELRRVLQPGGQVVVLLAAWITGTSLRDRLMTLLFRATGQVPPADTPPQRYMEPFVEAGYQTQIDFVDLPGSRVLFVIARP